MNIEGSSTYPSRSLSTSSSDGGYLHVRSLSISVCEACGTMEAIIAAQKGGLNINITGANADTARDFKRVGLRDWKMVRSWMGLKDID